ncbi:hypothetical protein [Streptomyces sp. NPDC003635]
MGWGKGQLGRARDDSPRLSSDLTAAAVVAAGQIPVVWLVWWIGEQSGDDYGYGINSLGIACVVVFAPLVLHAIGLIQAVLQAVPAFRLGRFVASHARGPRLAWDAACGALLGVGWAAVGAALTGRPVGGTALQFGALGILPVLGVTYIRRRPHWGFWKVWFRTGLASLAVFVLVGIGGVLASVTGLLKEYEPPVLSAGQLTGVWRSEEGAVLRLEPGGRAEFSELPTETDIEDWTTSRQFAVCDGTGTWTLERENAEGWVTDRDGVELTGDEGCGRRTYWTIGGTERDPELYVLFGDPDAGDLRILRPQRPL